MIISRERLRGKTIAAKTNPTLHFFQILDERIMVNHSALRFSLVRDSVAVGSPRMEKFESRAGSGDLARAKLPRRR
jgi:hypothetical protein